jgi:hypothetical protein
MGEKKKRSDDDRSADDYRPENVGDLPPLAERRDTSARSNESEIRSYFESRLERREIAATTETPRGQVIDWIPIESQVPKGVEIAEPPGGRVRVEVPTGDWVDRPVTFELEEDGAERGPEGTVPVLRKDLERISFRQTLDQIIGKYPDSGREYLMLGQLQAPPPSTDGPHRYASTAQQIIAFGCEGVLSAFDPYGENSDDFSLMQTACTNNDIGRTQSVEAGWQQRRDSYGDWVPHLFTYYTTNGYTSDGDDKGGYNQDVDGWVQVDGQVHPGALSSPNSVPGGAQYFMSLKYQLFNANWWLMCNGRWLGYYPARLFMGSGSVFSTLGDHADHIHFYGEIYDSNVTPGKTKTDMGSGYWPEYGWTWAAYQRNLLVQIDRGGTMADYDGGTGWASDSDMYRIETHMRSGGSWASYFWMGGPGAG